MSYVVHFTCRIYRLPTVDLLPMYKDFMTQLVEQRRGIAEAMGLVPTVALKSCFQAIKKEFLKLLTHFEDHFVNKILFLLSHFDVVCDL